jgi:hypothetical protein
VTVGSSGSELVAIRQTGRCRQDDNDVNDNELLGSVLALALVVLALCHSRNQNRKEHTVLNIQQFATAHDLKTRNEDGVKIIPGIDESHIYQYDDTHFGLMYMDSLEKNHATYRKQCLALGMEIHQDGDTEFAATFDPKNEKQAKQAIQVAGCRFPGHRESTAPKKFVNCMALERGTFSNLASESLG